MVLSDQYIYTILKNKIKNKSTYENYVVRLKNLCKILDKPLYTILKNPNIEMIQQAYPKSIYTQRNIVTVILSIFKNIPTLANKKQTIFKKWLDIHSKLDITPPSQQELITKEHIRAKYLEYKREHPHKNLQRSQEYLILSISLFSPSNILKYMQQSTKGSLTDNKYLVDDISDSVKAFPRSHVFLNNNKVPFISNNSYTVYVGRVLKRLFATNIGVNIIKNMN
jgi:hypothetical protein